MSLTIDVQELETTADVLTPATFDRLAGPVAEDGVQAIADAARTRVRAAARRHRRTGKMESRVTIRATGDGIHTTARVHAGGRAPIIVGGSRPHLIRPVRAHVLAISGPGRITGFAAMTHHPGTRADPFVMRGLAAADADIEAIVTDEARELLTDLTRRIEGS